MLVKMRVWDTERLLRSYPVGGTNCVWLKEVVQVVIYHVQMRC